MAQEMKSEARVVAIGGGVVGASVLYHLTKHGWTDVMLLERSDLTFTSSLIVVYIIHDIYHSDQCWLKWHPFVQL